MLTFEFGQTRRTICSCCSRPVSVASGWICRNGVAFSAYRAALPHQGADNAVAEILVVLGPWEEDSSPKDRVMFALLASPEQDAITLSVIDAFDTAWAGVMATPLGREVALADQFLAAAMTVCEAILQQDDRVRTHLEKHRPPSVQA